MLPRKNTIAIYSRNAFASFGMLCVGCSGIAAELQPGQVDPARLSPIRPHYQTEYTWDHPSDPQAWTAQKPGLHAAFGTTDQLYLRCEVPEFRGVAEAWEATGWRGERLNAQLLLWSPDPQEQVRLAISDLKSSAGHLIPRDHVRVQLVRYVLSNFPYGATNFTCDVTNPAAYLMPDRLEAFERFDLPRATVRPIWISLDLPSSAQPGDYSGTIQVTSATSHSTLHLTAHVQAMTLPEPHDWKFRLDLWQNPWAVARFAQVEPWSAEHKSLLRKHLSLYAAAGGKYLTTYAVHSPWSDNSYWLEGAMIEWIKTSHGTWRFDYSIFDQYVALAIEAGIDKAITIYTPVPWGHRFRFIDEASGNYVTEEWSPGSEQFRTFWNSFLDDLKTHLVAKGWFSKTYLGINENPLEFTRAAAKVIKEHSQDWKITYAGDWHPELSSLLDDYSVIITREPSRTELRERSGKGLTTTFYVCCNPPRPNNFVFSPPVESRYLGWYTAAFGYDGFLRWAYDAWPADPMRDARHTLWPAGDCFLVYPGGNSSIRFEKLREGIVDYEKIVALRQLVSKSANPKATALMKGLEAHLETLSGERDYAKRDFNSAALATSVEKGRSLIEAISIQLGAPDRSR